MKLYDIKKCYKQFNDAIGNVGDDITRGCLWNDMIKWKCDAETLNEQFEDWIRNSEMAKKYIKA